MRELPTFCVWLVLPMRALHHAAISSRTYQNMPPTNSTDCCQILYCKAFKLVCCHAEDPGGQESGNGCEESL